MAVNVIGHSAQSINVKCWCACEKQQRIIQQKNCLQMVFKSILYVYFAIVVCHSFFVLTQTDSRFWFVSLSFFLLVVSIS